MLEAIATSEPWTGQRIDGIAYPPNIEALWSAEDLAAIGLRVRVVVPPPPPEPTLASLKAHAADKRWQVETGGCPWGAHVIATDRDSQSKLIAEFVALSAGLRTDPSPWKMASGAFVILTNAQMLEVILAARAHIVAAFAVEADVVADIDTNQIVTDAEIDAADWPANS